MTGIVKDARTVATVLKADISGSTALGERLDPEELRVVLGSYFAALAREIHRRGGVIDKYVGDGVFALFGLPEPRADDASRAVVAAVAMQEAIERENVELHRKHGVLLACRIGIATGDVVGGAIAEDVQATYTVVGPPVGMAEALESAAPLGAVLVSPTTRTAARAAIRFAPLEVVTPKGSTGEIPAYRVVGLRHATREAVNVARAATTSASLQVASNRQDVLAEERKVVTILFADISTSEPLGSRLDVPELRTVLGAYFGVLARAIQRYGGTIDKYIGDAVMAVFGAPVSHEDDGVRAIGAALAIQRAARALNAALEKDHGIKVAIRIGINTGEVVAGLLPGEVLAYTVTGDAVNTAQRIESAAPPDGVLVSESTLGLARKAFVFEEVPPLKLKGKTEPVPAYRVVGLERRASPRGGPTIVGRQDELSRLFGYYRDAIGGQGQVVHVHGEAGVGKTRLVAELMSGLPAGSSRIRARANSYEQATPYALVAELVRRMFSISAADDEPTARAALETRRQTSMLLEAAVTMLLEILGYEIRSPLDPAGKRRLIVSLLRDELKRRADIAPLVVLIEDLHWCDASSAGVLAEAAAAIAPLRCLFISTSREATDIAWPSVTISLGALDPEAAEELLDHLAASPLDERTRALILDRTAGNPFFMEEVVRSLRPGKEVAVPATVQDLLEARLDRLDMSPRRVVQGASVIGRTFWKRVLARVTPDENLDGALSMLESEHFLARVASPEPTFSFPHALVQEVVYSTQLIAHRRRSHVVVGDAYTDLFPDRTDELIDTLAFHYRRGDNDPKAVRWLLRAGQRAQRLYATAEALDYFGAASERSTEPEDRATAQEGLGDVQRVTGAFAGALASFARALDAAPNGDTIRRARLLRKTGVIKHLQGDTEVALRVFQQVLADLPDGSERARALQNIGEVRWRQGLYGDAVESLLGATREAERSEDPDATAEALKQLGSAYLLKGDLENSVRCYERALKLYESLSDVLGQANVLNNIGAAHRRQSRHGEALAAYNRSLEIRRRIGDQLGIAHSRNNLGEIHFLRGDLESAEMNFSEAVAISAAIGYVGLARVGLGATRVARGDRLLGRADLHEAVRELEHAENRTYLADALRDLAISYLSDDDAVARKWALRAVEVANGLGSNEKLGAALQVLGRVEADRRETAAAIATLERSLELLSGATERQEMARTMAYLARAYGSLPPDDPRHHRGEELEEDARTILTELGAELDLRRMDAS